jgi:hypothetical protein
MRVGVDLDGAPAIATRGVSVDSAIEHLAALVDPVAARSGAPALRAEIRERLRLWVPPAGAHDRVDPVAVLNKLKVVGTTTGDPLWDAYVATGRRMVSDLERRGPGSTSFRLVWRRTVAGARRVGSRDHARVRMPLVVRDRPEEAPAVAQASHSVRHTRRVEGGLDVVLSAPAGDDVYVEVETSVLAHRISATSVDAVSLSAEERSLWTQPFEGLVRVTPRVRELATRLSTRGVSQEGFLEEVWRFLFSNMRAGALHHFEIDAVDPARTLLEGGWFDCYAGGALLAALCRAREIPARLVHGIALHAVAPVRHFWTEVYVGGAWRPFDLWDLAGGRIEDESWSFRFFGRLEPRAVLECFPHAVTGPPGFHVPGVWVSVMSATARGIRQSFLDGQGKPIWSDELCVDHPGA